MVDKPIVNIEFWFIRYSIFRGGLELVGNAINHPKLGNSKVYTSKILNIDVENMKVETLNTIYLLGKSE